MTVIVMRGIPGSGKTTLIRKRWPGAVVVSADDHFVGRDGVYRFDPKQLGEAHAECLRRFTSVVSLKGVLVPVTLVVDNTGVSVAEVAPYVALALAYRHEARVVTLRCDPEVAHERNVHGVPRHACDRMAELLDSEGGAFPLWWTHEVLEAE